MLKEPQLKPDARVIAWMWGWNSKWSDEAISLLNDDVIVMCTSEEAMPTNISGVRGEVIDYTISIPGPGKRAVSNWSKAAASGHKTAAKVQLNNTWECSAVPYLPVIDLVAQHLDGLVKSDINGLMLSWTLGGYPSLNLEYASQIYWDEDIIRCNDENGYSKENKDISSIINVFNKQKYWDIAATHIRKAWNTFSSAFKNSFQYWSSLYCTTKLWTCEPLHEKTYRIQSYNDKASPMMTLTLGVQYIRKTYLKNNFVN